ncbi:MAG: ribbon-helix-helix protein, CopG family [Deltaproteobacteria bacterium]|nr:ribbon-helix-helix protein, CopG family [Deltaproteobacteria bacterium]
MRTTKLVSISILPELLAEAEKLAKEENRTRSELIREALRRYISERRWQKLTQYARLKAAEAGIETEEDVLRLIDEYRREQADDQSGG